MNHRPNTLVQEHPRSALGTAGLRRLDWAPRQRPHGPLPSPASGWPALISLSPTSQDPKRFPQFSRLTRYCRLGIRDRTSDDNFQHLP